MSGSEGTSSRRALRIAALGFAVFALGYLALATPLTRGAWEWFLCTLGPLIIALAVLSHGRALRGSMGTPAFVLVVIALLGCALEFLPLALGLASDSAIWAEVPYELWGSSWIVAGLAVVAGIAHWQARSARSGVITPSFAAASLLSTGMVVYGIGFDELGTDRLNHIYGAEAFVGAVLIAVALIGLRRPLTSIMGPLAAGIVIVVVSAWALKDIARVFGEQMSDATFAREMIFGFGGVAFLLGAIACLVASRREIATERV